MSIRLRLTLLYTIILALVLLILGGVLYVTQARTTFREYQDRVMGAARFLDDVERASEDMNTPPPSMPSLRPPDARRRFPLQPYIQIRNENGELLETDPLLDETVIPITPSQIARVQQNERWFEIITVENERFLVYTREAKTGGQNYIVQIAVSLAERDRYLSGLGQLLLTGMAIVLLVAFGIGWFMAGLALQPIKQITQTAQLIGAERDFSRRVDHTGPNDEIGELANTFNGMLFELEGAFSQMKQSLQVQQQFTADASHELRTPLTTIRGNIDLLQRKPPIDEEDRDDVLVDTAEETERLMRLVNNLLVLARTDTKRELKLEPVEAQPLIEDVYKQIKRLAPQRSITCADTPDVVISANRDAFKQILLALLDNAVKHTPLEAAITLRAGQDNGRFWVSVADTGPGIPPTHLSRVFDRFFQSSTSRTGGGYGLGLSIAKELTEAQGGSIAVQSEAGCGTTFTVTLPNNAS